jgi:hypothetical protein
LVVGGALAASGDDEVDDDAWERMAETMALTACLYACWSGDEVWLEREAASGVDGAVAVLQNQTIPSFRRCA